MKNLQDASKDLMDHLIFALNHSMDLKKDGVDPMIPFAVIITGTNKVLKAFLGDTPDYADEMFEKTIADENPDYMILATDSYLTKDGTKYDAVLFKAYDKTDSEIYLVGQKFNPKSDTNDFEQIGNPGFLGTVFNNIKGHSVGKNKSLTDKKPWWKIWK